MRGRWRYLERVACWAWYPAQGPGSWPLDWPSRYFSAQDVAAGVHRAEGYPDPPSRSVGMMIVPPTPTTEPPRKSLLEEIRETWRPFWRAVRAWRDRRATRARVVGAAPLERLRAHLRGTLDAYCGQCQRVLRGRPGGRTVCAHCLVEWWESPEAARLRLGARRAGCPCEGDRLCSKYAPGLYRLLAVERLPD